MSIILKKILSRISFYEILEFYYSKMYEEEFNEYIENFKKSLTK